MKILYSLPHFYLLLSFTFSPLSFGSEEAPIKRDDSGDAIGDAGIIGIGGESEEKEEIEVR